MQPHARARSLVFLTLLFLMMAVAEQVPQSQPDRRSSMLQLTSRAFRASTEIPREFTCEGRNVSPELSWSGAPPGTKSFALVMHDPDAPVSGGYTHWIVFNIPATVDHISEHAPNQDILAAGGVQGKNDSGRYGYTGPCPPSGTHRYYFRLYALDEELDSSAGTSKEALEKAIQGHVLAQAELLGRYKRLSAKTA